MRYMIIERFKEGAAGDIYVRLAQKGRMMPSALHYIDSWISADLRVCYQLMEADDAGLFAEWMRHGDDLIEFETVPVISSAEARVQASAEH